MINNTLQVESYLYMKEIRVCGHAEDVWGVQPAIQSLLETPSVERTPERFSLLMYFC